MTKNLVIVESPSKAKTIQKFLGKDYSVVSSFGHIRDLPSKSLSIDIENNFQPQYEVSEDKKKIVRELKKLTKHASSVWLASDEDREGEAIAWHLSHALNLKEENTKRIVFHEITKNAILKAIDSPRAIDKHLVDAQQARRVLDRIVGYELSPVLWKKVKPSLSAGRVQSVAVKLIAEREKEINDFQYQSAFRVRAELITPSKEILHSELNTKFKLEADAHHFLNACVNADLKTLRIEKKKGSRFPSGPFTTATLQQEASLKLGFSVSKTMLVAQKLYESGKITYMRTDSVNLSQDAINAAKTEITSRFGDNYAHARQYSNKSKNAQEAHEAIRPSYLNQDHISGESDQERLYKLIWNRTIASQMSPASVDITKYTIGINNRPDDVFESKGEVLTFDGFLKVYGLDANNSEQNKLLPKLNEGDILNIKQIVAKEKFSSPPARFTEASLVKKLEQLGIGRPSTYAPTISTIQNRGYVIKEDRDGKQRVSKSLTLSGGEVSSSVETENYGFEKKKIFPTDIGIVVNDFLNNHFKDILDFGFTADIENQFDQIAQGKKAWNKMIASFYGSFHKSIEKTIETAERSSGERLLGTDPKTGKNIIVRLGKFGPIAQIGIPDDEDEGYPKFASLLKHHSIQTIELEEALELFKLPRDVGMYKGKKVVAAIGRFGPYIRYDSMFCSLKSNLGDDPFSVDMERAIELIEEKIETEKNKYIKTFEKEGIEVLNGRFGPYIKFEKKNYKIPKTVSDPSSLSLETCQEIIANPVKSTRKRKNSSKKK